MRDLIEPYLTIGRVPRRETRANLTELSTTPGPGRVLIKTLARKRLVRRTPALGLIFCVCKQHESLRQSGHLKHPATAHAFSD